MSYNQLKPEEAEVIEKKGTEPPFSGEYNNWFRNGEYICRRCNAPIYRGEDKIHSNCGWPSFDAEIPRAVRSIPDSDGSRTEIICANCGAHLGHVFTGERLTDKDMRHCVNSLSMKFIPEDFTDDEEKYAVLGGGCFWCPDAFFRETSGVKGVTTGYAGGSTLYPTYQNIDGHAEVVKVVFDPEVITYEKILDLFFAMHDPTTPGRQGNDTGHQYRSIILYATINQKRMAETAIQRLTSVGTFAQPIVTEIQSLTIFHSAETYHQNYFALHPNEAYCQAVINPKLKKFRE